MYNDPEMQEIFEAFVVESTELLENLSQDLMLLESNPEDEELLNRIFRAFHTIKGTSSFMGFEKISTLTHHAEDILNKLRKFELKVNQQIIDVLLEVYDYLFLMIQKVKEGEDISNVDYSNTLKKIEVIKSGGSVDEIEPQIQPEIETGQKIEPSSGESKVAQVLTKASEIVSKAGDFTPEEYELINAAFEEVNKELMAQKTPQVEVEKEGSPEQSVNVVQTQEESVKAADTKIEQKPETQEVVGTSKAKESAKVPGATAAETIRIDVSRVESLMNLSGELVLGRNRLEQITRNLLAGELSKENLKELEETTSQIDFITSEIQASVMRMRMIPIGKLFQKAPRIVRDLAKQFNKKIQLIMEGEETEIDKGIIDELSDPLVHMLRNACDHGIEPPEERIKLGKPEVGTVYLGAEQEGNNIVIRISDDGRGMDPERLKAKAIERGLITPEEASQMSDKESYQLIFQPGFSTAQIISNVSGRGVGMDVVRTNILKLKGMIDIESEKGVGTTFIVKLPLTLAIIQGLLVRVHSEIYAIPLASVLEVVDCDVSKVSTINKREVIRIRSDILPLIRLSRVLQVNGTNDSLADKYVVVVGIGEYRVGLVVDELLGQQEIVIKSLGDFLGHIKGIAGVTILGDGSVVIIIDIGELVYSRS
ncbi:MAG: Signal transduction histidine kinase CheA [Candidatus Kapaibacterium sp.]|nr:MAG: Signal transduction histidine kinase CheA [Candidatus Kapabacteria bacterium]